MARGRRNKVVDTDNMHVGQSIDRKIDEIRSDFSQTVEPIEKPLHDDYMKELAFMEEPVTIIVHETTDDNEPNPVQVGCNGKFVAFFRGQPTTVKRKFVDCLIVKKTTVATPEITNGAGERTFTIKSRSALKYPFQIVEDKNPKGVEWLRRRMAEIT